MRVEKDKQLVKTCQFDTVIFLYMYAWRQVDRRVFRFCVRSEKFFDEIIANPGFPG